MSNRARDAAARVVMADHNMSVSGLALSLEALKDAERFPTLREGILECFCPGVTRERMLAAVDSAEKAGGKK